MWTLISGINGSGGGGISVPSDQIFDNIAARDAYFAANPDKLIDDAQCVVLTNPPEGLYQVYTSGSWENRTAIVVGPKGDPGDETELIDDTQSKLNRTYSSQKIVAELTALTKEYGADGRIRFAADKHWYFEVQESPGVWIQKFEIGQSAIVDVLRLVEGVKPVNIPTNEIALYNRAINVGGVSTVRPEIVLPDGTEFGFVYIDQQTDDVVFRRNDGTLGYVPKTTDLDLLFNDATRDNQNLILTRVNGSKVTIPFGDTYHAPSIKDLSVNIPTRITVGTDLNGLKNVYYNVANSQNITSLNFRSSEGQVSELALPQQDGHINTISLLSNFDTNTPKNIEFQITGVDTDGGSYKSNTYVVQVANPTEIKDIYYGASTADAANVDLTSFTKIPYVTSGQTESFTLPVSAGDYYYIFVPRDPGLDKIYNTTFGDIDVTTEFSTPPDGQKLENAQTVGGIAYDSYRRGPTPSAGEQDLKVVMK